MNKMLQFIIKEKYYNLLTIQAAPAKAVKEAEAADDEDEEEDDDIDLFGSDDEEVGSLSFTSEIFNNMFEDR